MENNVKKAREAFAPDQQQQDIAKELGIAKSTYSQYETNTRQPPLEVLAYLSDKYKVSIDYLVGFCNNPHGTKYGSGIQLTAEEETLVTAWRQADQRAKDDVAHALRNFGFEQEEPQEKEEPA